MTIKERVLKFIEYTGATVRQFEIRAGISNGAVSKMGNNTRRSIIDKILTAYPDLNEVWLLTGSGNMLNNGVEDMMSNDTEVVTEPITYVPLINIDSVGGVHSLNSIDASEQYVERMVPLPDARPGDVAIMQSGNSMAPTIPAGAILQIRQLKGWREYFGYGSDFVLWLTDERRITKQVLKYEPDPKNYVTCHSYNPEAADEELPKAMIKQVWKVVNVLINKGW